VGEIESTHLFVDMHDKVFENSGISDSGKRWDSDFAGGPDLG
jgi:hypothetical protein